MAGLIGAVVPASGSIIKAIAIIVLGLLPGLVGTEAATKDRRKSTRAQCAPRFFLVGSTARLMCAQITERAG